MFPITKNWYNLLEKEFNSEKYQNFSNWLNDEYNSQTIYPKPENVFNALNIVPYDKVKIVIIGQDPYHGVNQAHGLSFSVEKDVNIPPSLRNIYKELESDLNCYYPNNGMNQGVYPNQVNNQQGMYPNNQMMQNNNQNNQNNQNNNNQNFF